MEYIKRLLRTALHKLKLLDAVRAMRYRLSYLYPQSANPRKALACFYSQFIKKGDLCFDIGAYVGDRTSVFLELGGRVVCVDPQPLCLDKLEEAFGNNKRVSIVAKGISDREGFLELSICKNDPKVSTMSEKFKMKASNLKRRGYEWSEVKTVSVTTLDMLIAEYGMPAFCNVDVEGFEERAFNGLTKPISLICFEFFAVFSDEMKRCIGRLLSIGRYRFNFVIGDPADGKGLVLPGWVEADRLYKKMDNLKAKDPDIIGDIYARLI